MNRLVAVLSVVLTLVVFGVLSFNYQSQEDRTDSEDQLQSLLEDFSLQHS